MRVYYLDSSAWVKRYFIEQGSSYVRDLFDRDEPLACCALGHIEVSAAIARRQDVNKISPDRLVILRQSVFTDWAEMIKAPLDTAVLKRGTDIAWDLKLRGADALHLAAAQSLAESLVVRSVSLTLVTADNELLAAATMHQMAVLNPNSYTVT